MSLVNLRSHHRVRLPRKANLHAVKLRHSLFHESVINVFMHKYTGSGAAHLPLIEQNSQLQTVHRHIPFTVREENISRFAAQLQRGRYQFLRSRAAYLAAHLG